MRESERERVCEREGHEKGGGGSVYVTGRERERAASSLATGCRRHYQTTLHFTRSNCQKQSMTWSTSEVLHVLESPLLARIPPEIREIDFAVAPRPKEAQRKSTRGATVADD